MAILCLGLGQELWAPFMPRYLEARIRQALGEGAPLLGLDPAQAVILAVGLYGTWRDLQEAAAYWAGGWLGGRLGLRAALLLFSALPLAGYALLLLWASPLAAFLALPFLTVYDAISSPAALSVVGATVDPRRRTLGIALQSLQRRLPRVLAYLGGGALVAGLGAVGGVQASLLLSAPLVGVALLVQWRHLRAGTREAPAVRPVGSLGLVRRFDPQLKRLLVADALARVAEGMPRELLVLWLVALPALGDPAAGSLRYGQLLALQSLVALLTYVPIGLLAARGGSRKPLVAASFLCFALFPPLTWWLGSAFGLAGLVAAFLVGGLRELGEPARKAVITELVPSDAPTRAVGVYWGVRCLLTAPVPLLGALLWIGWGPGAPFLAAGAAGLLGTCWLLVGCRVR